MTAAVAVTSSTPVKSEPVDVSNAEVYNHILVVDMQMKFDTVL